MFHGARWDRIAPFKWYKFPISGGVVGVLGGVVVKAVIMESSVVLASSLDDVALITWVIMGRLPGLGHTWRWGVSSNVDTLLDLSISLFAACA